MLVTNQTVRLVFFYIFMILIKNRSIGLYFGNANFITKRGVSELQSYERSLFQQTLIQLHKHRRIAKNRKVWSGYALQQHRF